MALVKEESRASEEETHARDFTLLSPSVSLSPHTHSPSLADLGRRPLTPAEERAIAARVALVRRLAAEREKRDAERQVK